jgi:hypothetical protein
MRTLVFILALHIAFLPNALSQPSQNIWGRVVDQETQRPLPYATVMILEAGPIKGVTTGEDGTFVIEDVPVGRYNVLVSYTGYESYIMKEVLCESGKQGFLDIGLKESVIELGEVSIANVNKDETVNAMAGVSARSFTVEETEKFAGSWGDPARMASNYAGVFTNSDIYNFIVIRGNSPNGLIWRMEGIPIPNPNHFDYPGLTGGPISMINNNLLAQSDFLSGAFPSEYSNGISGVFDLRMRNGNSKKHEFIGQVGLLALEFGAEGPFSKKSNASFAINYRHSMLGLVDELLWVDGLPNYQDLSFKLNFPLKKGNFSVFGLAGTSSIAGTKEDSTSSPSDITLELGERTGSNTGIIGLKYVHFFSDRTRLVSNLSLSLTNSWERLDSLVNGEYTKFLGEEKFKQDRWLVSSKLVRKFNAKNIATLGVKLEDHFVEYYEQYDAFIYDTPEGDSLVLLPPWVSSEDNLFILQGFAEWKHRFTTNLTLYGGVNFQYFFMNQSYAIEPRANLKWRFKKNQSLSIGYGLHSQLQPFFYYLVKTPLTDDPRDRENYIQTNRELEFTKSHQFALGYDYSISQNLRLKAEVYYQSLFNVPVETRESPHSLINVGAGDEFPHIDSLVNNGTGRNTGIEFTLEKFLSNRYYFLTTASVLDSRYEGSDGITRNTTFNIHYNLNALIGYELPVGERGALNFNIRAVTAGGRRVIPHDEERTIEEGKDVYNYDESFELQLAPYARLDTRVGYRLNGKKASHEIAVDLTNITNRPNEYSQVYNPTTNQIEMAYQQGFFVIVYYRIRF